MHFASFRQVTQIPIITIMIEKNTFINITILLSLSLIVGLSGTNHYIGGDYS